MNRAFLLLVLAGAILGSGLAAIPTASACQPYTIYCPFSSQIYGGCGTNVPGPFVKCVLDAVGP